MAKITIIGGGQSGLQLGIGLLQNGYDVTVVSNRTPEQIRDGRVMSSQCMFDDGPRPRARRSGSTSGTTRARRSRGSRSPCRIPRSPARRRSTGPPGSTASRSRSTSGVKFPRWMEHFDVERRRARDPGGRRRRPRALRGGERPRHRRGRQGRHREALRARRRAVAVRPADARARAHLRDRDDAAARVLRGVLQPHPGRRRVLRLPGADDERAVRDHGVRGRSGRPDGLLGRRLDARPSTSRESKWILETFMPVGGRALPRRSSSPTPTASSPAASRRRCASRSAGCRRGGPCSGWPTRSSSTTRSPGRARTTPSKGAAVYLRGDPRARRRAVRRGVDAGDVRALWVYAEKVVGWTNALLLPPPPHVLEVLGAAGQFPAVAHRFANGFDNPPDFYEWFMDPDSARAYLAEVAA